MFLEVFSEGWDEPDTIDLDEGILGEGVLDGLDLIGVDESNQLPVWEDETEQA